jgi:hypothetical protein
MKSKTIIARMIIEVVVLVLVFSAVDNMTSPSEGTAAAVTEAVNKKQLEPIVMVEVYSAISSASVIRFALFAIQFAALLLLCSDAWALWQSRRKV